MYSNCYSPVQVTEIDEVKNLINRFYRNGGREAEASGAEAMIPYIMQRDEYNADIERQLNERSDEVRRLRDEKDKAKRESETHAAMYRTARNDADKAKGDVGDLKRVMKEMTITKGFARFAPKKLREQIKKLLA